jgi:anti-anti-sigma regulatory factor
MGRLAIMKPVFVEVFSGSSKALRAQLAAAAQSTLQQGKTTLAVGLDTLPDLDDPAIAAIIVALRKLRAAGGTIQLVTQREEHRRRLALTGLDQVFEVFASQEDADGHGRGHDSTAARVRFAIRAASAAIALAFGLALWPSGTSAQSERAAPDPAAAAILARLTERNPDLQTYEANVHVDVAMLSFPFLHPQIAGKTYFRRPDNYEVVFARLPWYAKGLEHLYADIGDPSTWDKKFVITADGERKVGGRREAALRMVERVRGMIDHEEVYVDELSWTIDELRYHYYNGGVISMRQGFSLVDGFAMVTSQTATITIPRLRAVATALYSDFHTNVAIDGSVFAKNQKAQQ